MQVLTHAMLIQVILVTLLAFLVLLLCSTATMFTWCASEGVGTIRALFPRVSHCQKSWSSQVLEAQFVIAGSTNLLNFDCTLPTHRFCSVTDRCM